MSDQGTTTVGSSKVAFLSLGVALSLAICGCRTTSASSNVQSSTANSDNALSAACEKSAVKFVLQSKEIDSDAKYNTYSFPANNFTGIYSFAFRLPNADSDMQVKLAISDPKSAKCQISWPGGSSAKGDSNAGEKASPAAGAVKATCTNQDKDGFVNDKTVSVSVTASNLTVKSEGLDFSAPFNKISKTSRMYTAPELSELCDQCDLGYAFVDQTLVNGEDGTINFSVRFTNDDGPQSYYDDRFNCTVAK